MLFVYSGIYTMEPNPNQLRNPVLPLSDEHTPVPGMVSQSPAPIAEDGWVTGPDGYAVRINKDADKFVAERLGVYDDAGEHMVPVDEKGSFVVEVNPDFVPINGKLNQAQADGLFEETKATPVSPANIPTLNTEVSPPSRTDGLYLGPTDEEDHRLKLLRKEMEARLEREAAEQAAREEKRKEMWNVEHKVFERNEGVVGLAKNRVMRAFNAFKSYLVGSPKPVAVQKNKELFEPPFNTTAPSLEPENIADQITDQEASHVAQVDVVVRSSNDSTYPQQDAPVVVPPTTPEVSAGNGVLHGNETAPVSATPVTPEQHKTTPDKKALKRMEELEALVATLNAKVSVLNAVNNNLADQLAGRTNEMITAQQQASEAEKKLEEVADGAPVQKSSEVIDGTGMVTVVKIEDESQQPESSGRDMVVTGGTSQEQGNAVGAVEKKWKKPVFNEDVVMQSLEGEDFYKLASTLTRYIRVVQSELRMHLDSSDLNQVKGKGVGQEEVRGRFNSLTKEEQDELLSDVPSIPSDAGEEMLKNHVLYLKRRSDEIMSLVGINFSVQHAFEEEDDKELYGIFDEKDRGPSMKEKVESLAQEARKRIKNAGAHMYEFYKNNPEAVKKVALGVGLVSASMALSFAAPVGTVATAAVWGAKLGLRGYGAYKAGEGVEKILRARIGRKQPGKKLFKSQENQIRDAKIATMIAAFALGSIFDWYNASFGAASSVADQVATGVDTAVSGTTDVAQHATPAAGMPTTGVGVEIPAVTPEVTAPLEAVARHADTLGTTLVHEVTVKSGDTLSHIILSDGLAEIIPPEELSKLSTLGKQNFISNLVSQLSPEQLRDIGIGSGDLKLMKVGEHIDIKKLADIAKEMSITVNTGGTPSKLSLLARALGLS